MAHDHHSHGASSELGSWLGVFVAGLTSVVMVYLVTSERLAFYLAPGRFSLLVLLGGMGLAGLVLLRIRDLTPGLTASGHEQAHVHHDEALPILASPSACDHDHPEQDEPGKADGCGAEDCCEDDHEHHDHGATSYWRYAVLAGPMFLLLAGPPTSLSVSAIEHRMSGGQREALAQASASPVEAIKPPLQPPVSRTVPALVADGRQAGTRQAYASDNRWVRVVGQWVPSKDFSDRYQLVRWSMTCCAADARPQAVTVLGAVPDLEPGAWVEVSGPARFVAIETSSGRRRYFPVIDQQRITPADKPAQPLLAGFTSG